MDGRTDILPRHSPRYAYTSRGKNNMPDSFKYEFESLVAMICFINVAVSIMKVAVV